MYVKCTLNNKYFTNEFVTATQDKKFGSQKLLLVIFGIVLRIFQMKHLNGLVYRNFIDRHVQNKFLCFIQYSLHRSCAFGLCFAICCMLG